MSQPSTWRETARHLIYEYLPSVVGALAVYVLLRVLWLFERLPHTLHWD